MVLLVEALPGEEEGNSKEKAGDREMDASNKLPSTNNSAAPSR
jgi:hypothetical protein